LYIGPFQDGLNVVHAPNGSGKSSLFEALRRGLMDRHNVKGEDINQIQPWGKNLAPKVIVEFKHNGDSFRITKQFIQAPMSLLEKKRNDLYEPDANSREADEQLQKLLTKNPPSKGLSRAEHWGWAQALWAPQGSLALGSLSSDVLSDIRGVLSAHLAAGGSSKVEKEIDTRYRLYFTSTGNLKKGKDAPESFRLQEKLIVARNELGLAQERYASFQQTSNEVEKLRSLTAGSETTLKQVQFALDKAQKDEKEFLELKAKKDKYGKEAELAEHKHNDMRKTIEQIRNSEAEVVNKEKAIENYRRDKGLKETELGVGENEENRCIENLTQIKQDDVRIANMRIMSDDARSFSEISSTLNDLRERVSQIYAARERTKTCELQRKALIAPDDETLEAIRQAMKERDDTNVLINASLMNVEVKAETELAFDVLTGDDTGAVRAGAGESVVFKGTPEVSFRIPDVATIRAWGPTGSIDELREKLTKVGETIIQLTEQFGTTDLNKLQQLSGQAKEIAKQIRDAEFQIGMLLGKEKQDELDLKKSELEQRKHGILKLYPEWATNEPDWNNLKLKAEKSAESHTLEKEQATTKFEDARKRREQIDSDIRIILTQIEESEKGIEEAKRRLNELKSDGRTVADRDRDLNEFAMSWRGSKLRLEKLEEELNKFQSDIETVFEKLKSQQILAAEDLEKYRGQEHEAIGSLKNLSESGSYTVLAEVKERIAQVEKEIKREKLEQDSIKLLHDTIDTVRKEALSSVSKPVEDEATKTLNFICGADLGRICLGDSFEPSQIKPVSYDSNVELANLSGGEREQLYFSVRLALADVLAQKERQLVVLDDVLTATDAGRLTRVLNVLEEGAKNLQIIVLTCHPERYQGLASAKFFDLNAA
jgi:DNA repair exonuclease SbcCD ATPase subunit